jgi:predicted Rossmann-fold nucleotide-binding protein
MGTVLEKFEYMSVVTVRVVNTAKIIVIVWRRKAVQDFLKAIDDLIVKGIVKSGKLIPFLE